MKLSNKIILGIILFLMFWVLAHYLTLLLMYKMGWYTEISRPDKEQIFYPQNVNVVRVIKCENIDLGLADTFHYSFTNRERAFLITKMIGDTLVLSGDTMTIDTIYRKDKIVRIDTNYHSFHPNLTIFLTGKERVESDRSGLLLLRDTHSVPLHVLLDNSDFNVERFALIDSVEYALRMSRLNISAQNNSHVRVDDGYVDSLYVTMDDFSHFSDDGCTVKTGTVHYSDSSSIHTTGMNFKTLQYIYREARSKVRVVKNRYPHEFEGDDY